MPILPAVLNLLGTDQQHHIIVSHIQYQGQGAYSCVLKIQSNGFACEKGFGFDNDEYFLAKLKEVFVSHTGEAELMSLLSENHLKIQAYDADTLLISGFIQEEQPFNQSLEFAFLTRYDMLERFISEFTRVVRSTH
jgi:hypothetical protein